MKCNRVAYRFSKDLLFQFGGGAGISEDVAISDFWEVMSNKIPNTHQKSLVGGVSDFSIQEYWLTHFAKHPTQTTTLEGAFCKNVPKIDSIHF